MLDSVFLAFVGVHGVGKSTTAFHLARILSGTFIDVEAYDHRIVSKLDMCRRQMWFFVKYVTDLLYAFTLDSSVVILSNHPLNVLPYNYWWIREKETADRISNIMLEFLEFLPRVDYLIYLYVSDVKIILERVKMRGRAVEEEHDKRYITFIDDLLGKYVEEYGHIVAREVIYVDGCKELEDRVRDILNIIRR